MIGPDEFGNIMNVLTDAFPENEDRQGGRLRTFYGRLKDFPIEEVIAAFQAHIDNEDRFPAIAQILKRIPSYMTDDQVACESWIRIIRECQPWSPTDYNPETGGVPTLERITQEERDVLEQIGGVRHLYDILEDEYNVEFMRKSYIAAFVASPGYSQIRGFIEKEVKVYALQMAEKMKQIEAAKPFYPCEKCQSKNVKWDESVKQVHVFKCLDCGHEYCVDPRQQS
jgi:DNA-directed RNA polymerase subunit RPC12/RpoP